MTPSDSKTSGDESMSEEKQREKSGARPLETRGFAPLEEIPRPEELARYIDHTILAPDATLAQVEEVCEEAKVHGFFSVCVHSVHVGFVHDLLESSETVVCAVVGFPLGASLPKVKAFETSVCVGEGASEIDMVLNVGALKSADFELVSRDIRAVVDAAQGRVVKVILECSLLEPDEIVTACVLAKGAGAHFVKTSTGFGASGATVEDVRLMRQTVGPHMGVKASGGVRDTATARAMIEAGANRLGCSSSVRIVSGKEASEGQGY